jgi:hypothetical protein
VAEIHIIIIISYRRGGERGGGEETQPTISEV